MTADQTPTPAEVIARTGWDNGYTTSEQNAADILAALAAAGYQVVPVPDDQTRRFVELAVPWLRRAWPADVTAAAEEDLARIAELLERAFLPEGDQTSG